MSEIFATMLTHYQAIVSMRRKTIVGYEALARAQDLNGKLIPPDILFANAAKKGETIAIDNLCQLNAMENFVKQVPNIVISEELPQTLSHKTRSSSESTIVPAEIEGKNTDTTFLSVNMDARQFSDPDKEPAIFSLIEKVNFPVNRLMLEVCEGSVSSNEALENFVKHCHEIGIMVAIDDLGKEYSNLDRIINMQPDVVKLDRELVKNIHQDTSKQNIVRAISSLSDGNGFVVLAEGVESWEETISLMELGIDIFQGFYFATPSPSSQEASNLKDQFRILDSVFSEVRSERLRRFRYKREELTLLGQRAIELLDTLLTHTNLLSALQAVVKLFPLCECVYVLNRDGEQISPAYLPEEKMHFRNSLFEPTSIGTDHSQKDYFYSLPVKNSTEREGSYLSDLYTSLVTGRRCRTYSQWFKLPEGSFAILCVNLRENWLE